MAPDSDPPRDPDTPGRPRTLAELALASQRRTVASAADAMRTAARAGERAEAYATVDVGETPSEVVYTENKLELHRYESLTDSQHEVPILVVYALVNRPYVLDLQRDRSVVRRLLRAGHDVYLLDWNEPSRLDRSLTLDDYVERYVANCVDVVRERSGRDAINVLGYCMGGTLSVVYTALHPETVNALGLLATGIRFDDTGGVLELWGDEAYYDPRTVTDTFGNVPGEFLDVGFATMDPVSNYLAKYVHLLDRLENEDFVRNFARMERWLGESVDVAGEVYAQFVEAIYQDDRLYRNELTVGDERVDLAAIDVPVLQIVGTYDHLVPPESSTPLADVVGTDDVTTVEYPTGHVGLAMSGSAHRDVWPEVAEWFLEQSARPALADVIGEGVEEALGVDVETKVTVGDVDEVEIRIADADGELARAVVANDARAIERFVEDALDVSIGLEIGESGIAVSVEHDGTVRTTVVPTVGDAIREEVREAVEDVDVAATYDLEDLDGVGPTYADRLRAAGIRSVSALAVADVESVAEAARTSRTMARDWREQARAVVGAGTATGGEGSGAAGDEANVDADVAE